MVRRANLWDRIHLEIKLKLVNKQQGDSNKSPCRNCVQKMPILLNCSHFMSIFQEHVQALLRYMYAYAILESPSGFQPTDSSDPCLLCQMFLGPGEGIELPDMLQLEAHLSSKPESGVSIRSA